MDVPCLIIKSALVWVHTEGDAGAVGRGELGMAAALDEDQEAFGARKAAEAADRKQWRAEQKQALDELLPKATGRCMPFTIPSRHPLSPSAGDQHAGMVQ
jgi:hypothetical protein